MIRQKSIIIFLIIFFGFLAFAKISQAATYYVSTSGNDSNSGTQSQPWAHCPGMSGWTGSTTLTAGDTVYFDNASTWTGTGNSVLAVTGGVTYDGITWGEGTRAILRAAGDLNRGTIEMNYDHPTYLTEVRGFEVDGASHIGSCICMGYPGPGRDLTGATKRINNIVAHDCGYNGESGYSYGFEISNIGSHTTSNVEIINNVLYNTARTGIALYLTGPGYGAGDNILDTVLVRGNEVYNTGVNAAAAGYGIVLKNDVRNATIEFNYVHNCKYGIGVGTSNQDGTNVGASNAKIRYNIITASAGHGFWLQDCYDFSFELYGNLIFSNGYSGIRFTDAVGTWSAKIYNNTLFQNSVTTGAGEIYLDPNLAGTCTAFELKNNIISSKSGKYCLGDETGGKLTAHNNNIYYRPDGQNLVYDGASAYTASNLSSWESSVYTSNPNFVNTSAIPNGFSGIYGIDMQPNADGLSTQSGDAIDKGANLGVTYNSAINLAGKLGGLARPLGASWDIGAYEYFGVSDTTPPAAPSGVTVS